MTRYYFYSHAAFMCPDGSMANIDLQNPQSWNAYAYVNNDPIDFTDPSGEGLFGFLLKLAGAVVSIFNPGLGAVIFGSSLPLGHIITLVGRHRSIRMHRVHPCLRHRYSVHRRSVGTQAIHRYRREELSNLL